MSSISCLKESNRFFAFIFFFLSLCPMTQAQEAVAPLTNTVIHYELEIAMGFDVIEKVDFDITSTLVSMEPEGFLRMVLVPQKKEIIFKGLKAGKTTLVFKDQFGKIKIKYDVTITGTASSESTFVEKDLFTSPGAENFEKLDFSLSSEVLVADESLLRVIITENNGIIYRGLKLGKTTVTLKDNLGVVRRKFNVVVTEADPSARQVVEKGLEVMIGDENFEKLDFNSSSEFLIGNKSLLRLTNHPDKKNVGIIFNGLKPGKTTVIIRDISGTVRRRYSVVIKEKAPSTNSEVDKNLDVVVGSSKNVKLNFEIDQKLLVDNVDLLKIQVIPYDFRLVFNGLKVGKTSVTIKDTLGVIRRKYNVNITDTAASVERELTLILGHDEIEKVDFDLHSKFSVANENILKVIVIPEKKEVIFKGLRPGRTSVLVRDETGDIGRKYTVFIPDPIAN